MAKWWRYWREQIIMYFIDRTSLRTEELCWKYGGTMPTSKAFPKGRVRVCDKNRWHIDSHTYAWKDEVGY